MGSVPSHSPPDPTPTPDSRLAPPLDLWLWNRSPVPWSRPATPIRVYRLRPEETEDGDRYEKLTSLKCVTIHRSLGTDPGTAAFRYAFDGKDPQSPQSIVEALSTTATEVRAIDPGDRLVVTATRPDGAEVFIFDGNAVTFGGKMASAQQGAYVVAKGRARTQWASPIPGQVMRTGPDVTTPIAAGAKNMVVFTDVPVRFNPDGIGNATIDGAGNTSSYLGEPLTNPLFVWPTTPNNPKQQRKPFTLATAAAYLIYNHATPDVDVPDNHSLDTALIAKLPIEGVDLDPNDPATYDTQDLPVKDVIHTGRDWPTALKTILADHGIDMKWELSGTEPGAGADPRTVLVIVPRQTGDLKKLYLQPAGSILDPARSNTSELDLNRDIDQVANRWTVVGAPSRYEATFILAPAFPSHASDATPADKLAKFAVPPPPGTTPQPYRDWIFDEAGEGSYANGSNTIRNNAAGDLSALFVDAEGNPAPFAKHRRKPLAELCTESGDGTGTKARFRLEVVAKYAGTYPSAAAADLKAIPPENRQVVTGGGFELLKDRIGVRLTCTDPNQWKIGPGAKVKNAAGADVDPPYPRGIVNVVEAISGSDTTNFAPFHLLLTVAIDGDDCLKATADRTDASPVEEIITRYIDARDRFKRQIVAPNSLNNPTATAKVIRDDTTDAQAEADSARAAAESGVLQGQVTVARFTNYYQLGDRIVGIEGIGLGLRTDAIAGGSTPVYPVIEGITWQFEDGQRTTLNLSDESQARSKLERKLNRKERR